jgi:hypothetical protein
MDQSVQTQLTGQYNPEAILNVLPKREKKPRNSYKTATRIVKNSVKGRTTKITKEQGFRNYLQYTDPLLLSNNEIDQSDIATTLAKILNVFAPNPIETEKVKEIGKYVSTQTPVDPNDIATEVQQKVKTDKSAAKIQALVRGVNYRKNKLPALIEADVLNKQNKAATKIQKVARGAQIRQTYNAIKPELDKSPMKKKLAYIEKGTPKEPLIVVQSPAKTRNVNKELNRKKEIVSKVSKSIETQTYKNPVGRPKGSKNKKD